MDCKIRYDLYRDARPSDLAEQIIRGVCLTHGLWSDSDIQPVRDNLGLAQQAQVNERLAQTHLEYGL